MHVGSPSFHDSSTAIGVARATREGGREGEGERPHKRQRLSLYMRPLVLSLRPLSLSLYEVPLSLSEAPLSLFRHITVTVHCPPVLISLRSRVEGGRERCRVAHVLL